MHTSPAFHEASEASILAIFAWRHRASQRRKVWQPCLPSGSRLPPPCNISRWGTGRLVLTYRSVKDVSIRRVGGRFVDKVAAVSNALGRIRIRSAFMPSRITLKPFPSRPEGSLYTRSSKNSSQLWWLIIDSMGRISSPLPWAFHIDYKYREALGLFLGFFLVGCSRQ